MSETASVIERKTYRKTPHRGVRILDPDPGKKTYRLRYSDPETGRVITRSLTPHENQNSQTRTEAAMAQYRLLRRRREDIAEGATPHRSADKLFAKAIDDHLAAERNVVAEATYLEYRRASEVIKEWAGKVGIKTCRRVSKGELAKLPSHIAGMKKMVRKKGGKRGEMALSDEPLSPHTVNKLLGGIGGLLNGLRRKEEIRLTEEDISESLREVPAEITLREFLLPSAIKQLLHACDLHDAETFKITRRRSTTTPRYKPVKGFIEFLLFAGPRVYEGSQILGSDVTLEIDQIKVRAEIAKHGIERTLDLTLSSTAMRRAEEWSRTDGRLFPLTEGEFLSAIKRLITRYGAPEFSPHTLRRTTSTFMACTPKIGPWIEASQIGHSVDVAKKHYIGKVKVDPNAETLEQAMGLEPVPVRLHRPRGARRFKRGFRSHR